MMQSQWTSPVSILPVESDEIQIWRLSLSHAAEGAPEVEHLLTAEERARAHRRLPGRVRDEFVYGRACLRTLLAVNLCSAPVEVSIATDRYGKPKLEEDYGIEFNLSHSDGLVLIALCRGGAVGVDVEQVKTSTDVDEIAPSVFSLRELEQWRSLETEAERRSAFFLTWTRKEAVIKADGRGLSIPLNEFDLPHPTAGGASITLADKSYCLKDIATGVGIAAAIAVESHNCRITMQDFPVTAWNSVAVKK